MGILAVALSGLLVGSAHVFVPDHLAAVAPLAIDQRRHPWRVGFMWGLGHSGGVWILALLALALRETLPIELVSAWSERLVGFVLVGIGVWGVGRILRGRVHCHVHEHDGLSHAHIHAHDVADMPPSHEHGAISHHAHTHSPLGIGALHGLAGTAHVLGVLPAALMSRAEAVAYIVAFGAGSIVAMTALSGTLGLVAQRLGDRHAGAYRILALSSCLAAIVVGAVWLTGAFGNGVAPQ